MKENHFATNKYLRTKSDGENQVHVHQENNKVLHPQNHRLCIVTDLRHHFSCITKYALRFKCLFQITAVMMFFSVSEVEQQCV